MERKRKNEILLEEIKNIKKFYEENFDYKEWEDLYQVDSHTLILYKVYDGEENYLRVQISIPTGARDGSFEDPSERALEYKKNVEKQNKIKERYEKIKIEKEKKDKEIEFFQEKIIDFLSKNKDNSYTSMQLSKELNIGLADIVTCLRKSTDRIIKIENDKTTPFSYKINI